MPSSQPRLWLIAIVAGFLLAACGSGGDDSGDSIDGELLDFALVQENDFTFAADPTNPERGIFRVRTTEPMICTIVWGETESFGNFNNSLSMNGTGIIDHDVALPGAEQGTEYFFRVQGSTADGRQFRSELGTFTIPVTSEQGAMADEANHGVNLALDATVVDTSSTFGQGWEAENALDGDNNTEWATAGDGDSGFITIDLGQEKAIAGVEFLTRSMLDGTATTDQYTVTIGDQIFGPFPAANPANPQVAEVNAAGQTVRFDIESSTGGNVGAIEVRVLAPAG